VLEAGVMGKRREKFYFLRWVNLSKFIDSAVKMIWLAGFTPDKMAKLK
jgi:hypothetical protein